MTEIRYMQNEDKSFWYSLDPHLPQQEFERKLAEKRGYVLLEDHQPIGLLRYNLFWDSIPFCTMLFIAQEFQGKGYGKKLMLYWESEMKKLGFDLLLTSTQTDEQAQHFYRKLGYTDCGGLLLTAPGHEQPMELFLCKSIGDE